MASLDWKSISGRKSGGDGYKFGDITRTIISKASEAIVSSNNDDDLEGSEHDQQAVVPREYDHEPIRAVPHAEAHDGGDGDASGSSKRSWKEAAGRRNGTDGYVFGDATRSLLSKAAVAGIALKSKLAELDSGGGRGGGSGSGGGVGGGGGEGGGGNLEDEEVEETMFRSFDDMMQQAGITLDGVGSDDVSPTNDDPVMRELWLNFFNAVYSVGKRATEVGLLTQDDLEDCSPELFLGLPALAAFECALRSAGSGVEGFVLFNGSVLHSAEFSMAEGSGDRGGGEAASESTFRQLMAAMTEITQMLSESDLSDESLFALRTKMIKASGGAMSAQTEEEEQLTNRVCAACLGVATRISQLSFFQKVFMLVVLRLQEQEASQDHLAL